MVALEFSKSCGIFHFFRATYWKRNQKRPSAVKFLKKDGTYLKTYAARSTKSCCAARSTVEPDCLCGESLACHSAGNEVVLNLKMQSVAHIGGGACSPGQKACCRGLPANWERPTYKPTGQGVGHTYFKGKGSRTYIPHLHQPNENRAQTVGPKRNSTVETPSFLRERVKEYMKKCAG